LSSLFWSRSVATPNPRQPENNILATAISQPHFNNRYLTTAFQCSQVTPSPSQIRQRLPTMAIGPHTSASDCSSIAICQHHAGENAWAPIGGQMHMPQWHVGCTCADGSKVDCACANGRSSALFKGRLNGGTSVRFNLLCRPVFVVQHPFLSQRLVHAPIPAKILWSSAFGGSHMRSYAMETSQHTKRRARTCS
jgi:hypothetical protein